MTDKDKLDFLLLAEGVEDRCIDIADGAAKRSHDARVEGFFASMFPGGVSGFERDARMQQLFGNPQGNKFVPDWKYLEQQFKIFFEEVKELRDAIDIGDWNELLDGIGDCITVLYAISNAAGVDADKVHAAVHRSNLTKFCRTEKELQDTLYHYAEKGINVGEFGEFPFKCVRTVGVNTIKDKEVPEGKFLKCVRFEEPDWTEVMEPYPEATRVIEALGWLDLTDEQRVTLQERLEQSAPIQSSEQVLMFLNGKLKNRHKPWKGILR